MKYHMNSTILKMSMGLHLSYVYCAGIVAILSSLDEDGMLNDLDPDLLWYLLGEELECGFDAIMKSYHEITGPKRKRIKKAMEPCHPSLEMVKDYCKERKNNVDPEKWFDYYTSKGWKIGRELMKDWKAAVRTWEKNQTPTTTKTTAPKNPALDYAQRDWSKIKDEDFFVDLSQYGG